MSTESTAFPLLRFPGELQDEVFRSPTLGGKDRANSRPVSRHVKGRCDSLFRDRTYILIGADGIPIASQTGLQSTQSAKEIILRLPDSSDFFSKRWESPLSALQMYSGSSTKLQKTQIEFKNVRDQALYTWELPFSHCMLPTILKSVPNVQLFLEDSGPNTHYYFLISIPGKNEGGDALTKHYIGSSKLGCSFFELARTSGLLLYDDLRDGRCSHLYWVDPQKTDWQSHPLTEYPPHSDGPAVTQAYAMTGVAMATLPPINKAEPWSIWKRTCNEETIQRLSCISSAKFIDTEAGHLLLEYLRRESAFGSGQGSSQ